MGPARAGSVKSYPRIEPPTECSPQGHELVPLIYFVWGGEHSKVVQLIQPVGFFVCRPYTPNYK